ncbi:MAG: hypothetical protein RRY79_00055 [Clostridia bacterium]
MDIELINKVKTILREKRGIALMISMCILLVCTSLSLAILLSSASRMSSVKNDLFTRQSYITAISVTDILDAELAKGDTTGGTTSEFCYYIRVNFPTWLPYQGGNMRIATYNLNFKDGKIEAADASSLGKVTLKLYRDGDGDHPYADTLVLTVSADYGGSTYNITRKYIMKFVGVDDPEDYYKNKWDGTWKPA